MPFRLFTRVVRSSCILNGITSARCADRADDGLILTSCSCEHAPPTSSSSPSLATACAPTPSEAPRRLDNAGVPADKRVRLVRSVRVVKFYRTGYRRSELPIATGAACATWTRGWQRGSPKALGRRVTSSTSRAFAATGPRSGTSCCHRHACTPPTAHITAVGSWPPSQRSGGRECHDRAYLAGCAR